MKKGFKLAAWGLILNVLLVFAISGAPAFADSFQRYITISVAYNGTGTLSNTSIIVSLNNSQLASLGYINTNGLNTGMQEGGVDKDYMVQDGKIAILVDSILSGQTRNYQYLLDYAPAQTNFGMAVGAGGYFTITDAASIELGNNFAMNVSGYFDTSVTGNIVSKSDAFTITSGGGNVSAAVTNTSPITAINQSLHTTMYYTTSYWAQTFTAPTSGDLTQITVYGGGYVGRSTTFSIYATNASGIPVGPSLESKVWTGNGDTKDQTVVFDTPVPLTSGTKYAIVDYAGGINWYYQNTDVYAGGNWFTSSDGTNWTPASYDVRFSVTMVNTPIIAATAVASGEHTVDVSADGSNLRLWVDGSLEATTALSGASVPNNANNWVIMGGNSASYLDSFKITVGGVLKCWLEPATMVGTAFADRTGNGNNGTITWGANPAGVYVTVGALTESVSYISGAGTTETPVVVGNPDFPVIEDVNATGEFSATGVQMPQYDIVNRAAESYGIGTGTMYGIMMFFVAIVVFIAVAVATGAIVPGLMMGGLTMAVGASTLLSPWFLAIFLLLVGGMLVYVMRRT